LESRICARSATFPVQLSGRVSGTKPGMPSLCDTGRNGAGGGALCYSRAPDSLGTTLASSGYLAYENDKRSGNPRGSDYAIDHVQRRVVPEIRSAFAPAAEEDSGGDAEFELDAAAAADQVVMKH